MAFFGVTIETVERVWDHPNADRLSLAKAKNLAFQFVIGKNQFQRGDKILYFPLDAVLPSELIERLGMTGKLAGKDKNRIKSMRLRGELSQGFVTSPTNLIPEEMLTASPDEITSFLGVTKYEPPVQILNDFTLSGLPTGYSVYDIEGADRYQLIVDALMDQDVVVMEKMEGTNASYVRDGQNLFVNQRTGTIIPKDGVENTYWGVARNLGYLDTLQAIEGNSVALYGELCGPKIQGNIYNLKSHTTFLFDMKRDGNWVDFPEFLAIMEAQFKRLPVVPILFVGKLRDFLNGRTVQEASNGKSIINPEILREGIVIKPLKEQYHPAVGRLIIKQRSPDYLVGEK